MNVKINIQNNFKSIIYPHKKVFQHQVCNISRIPPCFLNK
jgi:hypothetical protein